MQPKNGSASVTVHVHQATRTMTKYSAKLSTFIALQVSMGVITAGEEVILNSWLSQMPTALSILRKVSGY